MLSNIGSEVPAGQACCIEEQTGLWCCKSVRRCSVHECGRVVADEWCFGHVHELESALNDALADLRKSFRFE